MRQSLGLLLLVTLPVAGCSSVRRIRRTSVNLATVYHHNNLGVALMDQGMAMNDRKYFAQAAREFEQAVALKPDYVRGHVNLGIAYYFSAEPGDSSATSRYAKAKEHLATGRRLDPKNAAAHFMLGMLTKNNQEQESLVEFREAARLDPGDWSSHYMVGAALYRQGKLAAAETSLRTAVSHNPGAREAAFQLFMALQRQGKTEEARKVNFTNLPEGAQGDPYYFYLRPGKLTEAQPEPIPVPPAESTSEARTEQGFAFIEATAKSGLQFLHRGSASDPDVLRAWSGQPMPRAWFVKNAMKLVSAVGSGVACADFDGDGLVDVFFGNCNGPNALYRNKGGGVFEDVTARAGVGGNGKPAMAAVWGDYDNDGRPDLLVTTYGGVILYHNEGSGKFKDVTKEVGLDVIPPTAWCTGAAFADVDHDADLDIYICNYVDLAHLAAKPQLRFPYDFPGGDNFLFRNNTIDRSKPKMPGYGAKKLFTEIAREAKVTGGKRRSLGVIFSDFNDDNAVDFYVVNDGEPNQLFWNLRDRTFAEVAEKAGANVALRAGGVTCADFNQDGYPDLLLAPGAGAQAVLLLNQKSRSVPSFRQSAAVKIAGPVTGLVALDANGDGFLDLLLTACDATQSSAHSMLWSSSRDSWRDVTATTSVVQQDETTTLAQVAFGHARGMAVADFNNDGAADIIVARNGGRPALLLGRPGKNTHTLRVKATGCSIGDSPQSNRNSIGAKIEVLSPGRWQKREIRAGGGYLSCDSPELTFSLGAANTLEFARGIWPSGIRGSLTSKDAKVAQLLKLDEPAGIPPSCPYVYVWNGERFEFLADTLAGGTLGELISPTGYLPLNPHEYLKIDGDRLKPREGAYELRLVNQNPETDFIDQARLLAVDHPADVEVYPNERMTGPPFPKFKVWAIRDARPPIAAFDDQGRDLFDRLKRRDRVYHADPKPLPWRGFSQRHSLTLDLGSFDNNRPVLLLNGWIDWGGSSTALGAGQAGVLYEAPKLEVIRRDGKWHVALADMGLPAGRPRTIVVPLAGLFPTSDHRVRISTNMTIYWDQIRIGFETSSPLTTHHSPLTSAQLHWLGYPRAQSSDGKLPGIPDYNARDANRDYPTQTGNFTRYGEVTPLLRATDDAFVIMNHGDEIQMRFEAALPPLRPGWRRDFLAYFHGYGKSTDVNTAHSLTVAPLPFRAMSAYPYSAAKEHYSYAKHAEYLLRYNTRAGYER